MSASGPRPARPFDRSALGRRTVAGTRPSLTAGRSGWHDQRRGCVGPATRTGRLSGKKSMCGGLPDDRLRCVANLSVMPRRFFRRGEREHLPFPWASPCACASGGHAAELRTCCTASAAWPHGVNRAPPFSADRRRRSRQVPSSRRPWRPSAHWPAPKPSLPVGNSATAPKPNRPQGHKKVTRSNRVVPLRPVSPVALWLTQGRVTRAMLLFPPSSKGHAARNCNRLAEPSALCRFGVWCPCGWTTSATLSDRWPPDRVTAGQWRGRDAQATDLPQPPWRPALTASCQLHRQLVDRAFDSTGPTLFIGEGHRRAYHPEKVG